MIRKTEETLADFVALQAVNFDIRKWKANPHETGASVDEVTMVALFLAQTTFGHEIPLPAWFHHRNELTALSSGREILNLISVTKIQPSRFAAMLDAALRNDPNPPEKIHLTCR